MKWLSILAVVFSITSLGISFRTWQQADQRAEEALQRREKAIVEKHRPAIVKMCREFGIEEPAANAASLDELCSPLGKLLKGLSR